MRRINGRSGILGRRHDDEIGSFKARCVRIINAAALTSRHRMAGDKLHPARKKGIDLRNDLPLHTGHIADQCPAMNPLPILLKPVDQCMRIQRKDHQVRILYKRRIIPALFNPVALLRLFDRQRININADHMVKARRVQRLHIAAAKYTKTNDRNPCVRIQHH